MCNQKELLIQLKDNVSKLNLSETKVKKLLNLSYDRIYIGQWKSEKNNKIYTYYQLKAYKNSKHITLKHFKNEKLIIAENIFHIYTALKCIEKCLFHSTQIKQNNNHL